MRVTLISSVGLAILAAALTMYIAPWASEQEYQLKEQAKADAGLSALRAGRFQETGNEKAVVFIHNIEKGGKELNKVFVAQLPDSEKGNLARLVYAEQGVVVEAVNGEQQLVLTDGKRYETDGATPALNLTEFDGYSVQIREQEIEHQLSLIHI